MRSKYFYLYLIIFLEGYVVLSTELIAIRQLIPFVGSGTETVAIIISAVLMPLAFGYYFGGKFKAKQGRGGLVTIREKLIRNVLNSTVFLVIGLSYILLQLFFFGIDKIGIHHRVFQTSVYAIIFLVAPIFMLGQTVPLISNFFMRENLSKLTGKILFFSTLGSFMGAIISTIILMSLIGVNNTLIFNIAILALVVVILSKRILCINNILMAIFLVTAFFFNSTSMMRKLNIVENNRYSTISIIKDHDGGKIININNSSSGKYSPDPEKRFPYLQFIEKTFINPLLKDNKKKKILVLGAGGFTIGVDDKLNDYTFVDIDFSLKDISEKYLLPEKLGQNKKFNAQDARAFLSSNKEKYDLIFLDVFSNIQSIPSYLLTLEFFKQVDSHLENNGVMIFNCITNPAFSNRYSVKLDNTLREVFPNINRQIIGEFNGWDENPDEDKNIIYMYFNKKVSSAIYTDDKNTYFLDH